MSECTWCNTEIEGKPVFFEGLRYHPHCLRELTSFFTRNVHKHTPKVMPQNYDWDKEARKAIAHACLSYPNLQSEALKYALNILSSEVRELFPEQNVTLERISYEVEQGNILTLEEKPIIVIRYQAWARLAHADNWEALKSIATTFRRVCCVDRLDVIGSDAKIFVAWEKGNWVQYTLPEVK